MGPNYSAGTNFGTQYQDPNTGAKYVWLMTPPGDSRGVGYWAQTGGPSNQAPQSTSGASVGGQDIASIVQAIMGGSTTPAKNTNIQFAPSDFKVTSANDFMTRAFNELKPYYAKLLQDAGGDLDRAKQYLEEDYTTGKRITSEDLSSSLESLGIQFPKEQEALAGSLNQRGIAVTQAQPGDPNSTTYAGSGRAQTEVQNLTEDQKLRKEAVERTASRSLESLTKTNTRGKEEATRQAQIYGQDLQKNLETEATSRAGLYASNESAANQANLQQKILTAQYSPDQGGSTAAPKQTSGNWMDYYKGWDQTAAQGDFNAVYGGDLGRLQAAKPL